MIIRTGTFYAKSLYGGKISRYALYKDGNYMTSICSPQISAGITHLNTSTGFQKHSVIMDRGTNIHTLYLNDTSMVNQTITTGSMNSTYNFLIGAYNNDAGTIPPLSIWYLNGTICEIIFFDRLLTTAENIEINAYLNTKYGV